jgi:hypothetical protein
MTCAIFDAYSSIGLTLISNSATCQDTVELSCELVTQGFELHPNPSQTTMSCNLVSVVLKLISSQICALLDEIDCVVQVVSLFLHVCYVLCTWGLLIIRKLRLRLQIL